jgi:hypothetical protein
VSHDDTESGQRILVLSLIAATVDNNTRVIAAVNDVTNFKVIAAVVY